MRMSSIRPFVQLPMTLWSTRMPASSVTGFVFSGRCGAATVGGMLPRSMSKTRSYAASSSAAKMRGSCCARPSM